MTPRAPYSGLRVRRRGEAAATHRRSQPPADPANLALRLPGYQGNEGLTKPASLVRKLDPDTAVACALPPRSCGPRRTAYPWPS